jgi:cell volume regulation protein A
VTVPSVFALAAFIILAGFAGKILFQRTRIPDIPLLLGIGVLMGPVLHIVYTDALLPLAPYVGTLALLMIMLEGGMNLNIDRVLSEMKWAVALTILAFVFTTLAIAGMYHAATGTPLAESLLLGGLLGCTSGAVVIPLVQGMRMGQNTRTILTLEAALGDALAVVTVFVILRYIRIPSVDLGNHILSTANAFLWSGILGVLAGLLWLRILARTGRLPLSYMLTMAGMLLLYALVEALHASGVFAVLVFGMVLSNGEVIMRWLPSPSKEASWEASRFALDETIGWFHEEMVFLARVFFFVYLGMLMDFRQVSPFFLGVSAALIAIVYAARQISVRAIVFLGRRDIPFERKILTTMAPRGLASAVLATVPAAEGIAGTEGFIQYAFSVIAVTNVLLTVSTIRSERRLDRILAETARTEGDAGRGES